MANDHYCEFIKEAFIKPIRSVLIIDDDYPTFDEILQRETTKKVGQKPKEDKSWYNDPERIKNVIDQFRDFDPPLLVDIHDGSNVTIGEDVKVAAHLHQSDLLVLDYQLDKSRPGDGSLAVSILRKLMSNEHFNMVVVHTTEQLDNVFNAVLLGLMSSTPVTISKDDSDKAVELIATAEDEIEGFNKSVFASIEIPQYLEFCRKRTSIPAGVSSGTGIFAAFKAASDQAGWNRGDATRVFRFLIAKRHKKLLTSLNTISHDDLVWSTGKTMWIKSNSLFVAFSNKNNGNDLIEELLGALNDWRPPPSRLFLAKIRAEMDEFGVVAQSKALGNEFALAHWYNNLLCASKPGRKWQISESVSRHSEQLMDFVLKGVDAYAERLVDADSLEGTALEVCKIHFKIDLSKEDKKHKAQREHNSFVCSKKPTGWHLSTGHIFSMGEDYWVCLSPSCDMVPDQLSADRRKTTGNRLPFIGVKLIPVRGGNPPSDLQTNRYIFIQIDGGVECFKFNEKDNSAPQWYKLYAENLGHFKSSSFELKIYRTEAGSRGLVAKSYQSQVISQLRYEYSLNLMQRLGATMTRVGLDFDG